MFGCAAPGQSCSAHVRNGLGYMLEETQEIQETEEQKEAFSSIFVARQPIFDVDDSIWGYELLFRDNPDSSVARIKDQDLATATVIADGYVVASEAVEPHHKLLINFPSALFLNGTAQVLPPEKCILEILETVKPSRELLAELRHLRNSGYSLALDDYVGQPELKILLGFSSIIKIDVLGMHPEDLEELVNGLRLYPALLLAEKVEDAVTHAMCKELGFSLFQGFFFAHPQIVAGRTLAAGQVARLTLMQETLSGIEEERLIDLINTDPGLTYRLLRYINSSWFSLIQNVTSVRQAVHLLGRYTVHRWLSTVLMADLGASSYSRELTLTAITRARFLEQLRQRKAFASQTPETLFLLGLLSCLDAQLGVPMEEALTHLPLDAVITEALTGQDQKSPPSKALQLVKYAERGAWDQTLALLDALNISPTLAAIGFNEAQVWARRVMSPLPPPKERQPGKPKSRKKR